MTKKDKDIELIFYLKGLAYLAMDQSEKMDQLNETIVKQQGKLKDLEKAISRITYIRGYFIIPKYMHKTNDLYITRELFIHFKGNAADLLKEITYKSSGKLKNDKYYISELEKVFKHKGENTLTSKNSIYQAAKKIQTEIQNKYGVGGIMHVDSKHFYFVSR